MLNKEEVRITLWQNLKILPKDIGYVMREIKFRAWDKKWSDLPLKEEPIADIKFLTDYIFCQFTGKYDINVKEIYEGDIVKFRRSFDDKYFVGEISYIEEHGAYFVIHSGISDNQLYAFDRYEVIGNIFENAELLNE